MKLLRILKKITATQIVKAIENNPKESRKRWLLWLLNREGKISFWQIGYHCEEIVSNSFMKSKVEYIHNNPVRAGIVKKPEDYSNSSARAILTGKNYKLELYDI